MKPVVLQASGRETLCVRRRTGPPERTRRAKAGIVNEDDEDVWRSRRRQQLADRRKLRLRIFRVVGNQTCARRVGNGQDGPWKRVSLVWHDAILLSCAQSSARARALHAATRVPWASRRDWTFLNRNGPAAILAQKACRETSIVTGANRARKWRETTRTRRVNRKMAPSRHGMPSRATIYRDRHASDRHESQKTRLEPRTPQPRLDGISLRMIRTAAPGAE